MFIVFSERYSLKSIQLELLRLFFKSPRKRDIQSSVLWTLFDLRVWGWKGTFPQVEWSYAYLWGWLQNISLKLLFLHEVKKCMGIGGEF